MADETPPASPFPTGWKPTTSTVGGAGVGAAVAQVVIATVQHFGKLTIDASTCVAITTICIALAGYLFPDGGRR